MTSVLYEGVVHTDYGQFDIIWGDSFGFEGEAERYFRDQINGLVGAASGQGMYVNLARRSGGSQVQVVLHDSEPSYDPSWEDVVEVSLAVPSGARPRWSTWAGEDGGDLDLPSGTYRVRVSARGRDAGRNDEFAEETIDFYLIDLWPAEFEPDAILQTTSEDAAYWHSEWGSRR